MYTSVEMLERDPFSFFLVLFISIFSMACEGCGPVRRPLYKNERKKKELDRPLASYFGSPYLLTSMALGGSPHGVALSQSTRVLREIPKSETIASDNAWQVNLDLNR